MISHTFKINNWLVVSCAFLLRSNKEYMRYMTKSLLNQCEITKQK